MKEVVMLGSFLAGSSISGSFRLGRDVEALLARMRQRPYPETIPVLASFWLKAVFERGYGLRRWKQLNSLLRRALSQQRLDEFSRQAILDIQTWIPQTVLTTREPPPFTHPRLDGICVTLTSDQLPVFIRRLL